MTTTRPTILLVASLILGAATLSACSSGGSQPAAAASGAPGGAATSAQPAVTDSGAPADETATPAAIAGADPCSLLTDPEAATVFSGAAKHEAGGSRDASNGNGVVVTENRCEWDEVKSSQLGYDLWVAVYAGADQAYFDDVVRKGTPIAGLGDAASLKSDEVWVIRKGTVVQFYGSLPGTDGLQKAAAAAVAHL